MRKIYLLICLGLLLLPLGWSQTTNSGMLYISPDTHVSTLGSLDNMVTGKIYNDGELYIYSHFYNDGEMDFYQETGTAKFVGSMEQDLDGLKTSYFHNIYFGNASSPAPFHLYGIFHIQGIAYFTQGVVDNETYGGQVSFAPGASHKHVSNTSHIIGEVQKIGDGEFTFPIGNGIYYRPAGTSPPGELQTSYRAHYKFENSNPLFPHHQVDAGIEEIDTHEYWLIDEEVPGREEMLVTLSWNEATTPASLIEAALDQSLIIVRWDANANRWTKEGGAINYDNREITTAVTGFGPFTLARTKPESCEVVVYNAITPNGDGKNDFFRIDTGEGDCAKNLQVKIFDRWGVKVFESYNYGPGGEVFEGFSTGRLTLGSSKQLPSGTYFYILEYKDPNGAANEQTKKAGYLYLSGN